MVKNTLVAADVAGSALPTSSLGPTSHSQWQRLIRDSLSAAPKTDELTQLIEDRLTIDGVKHPLRDFQSAVATNASEVTLVKAGCGSGKTLAAYHWARERCPGKRLYICYPTTCTATEGFRDYLFDKTEHQPKSGAELSLDLSATLLVTDLAPIPALIQRLGRLNRRAKSKSDPIMPFIVIEPVNADGKSTPRPYTTQQLDEARICFSKLPAELKQQDLVAIWESMGTTAKEDISNGSTWIDGGYDRIVKELRDASPGVTVIRRDDVENVRNGVHSIAEVVIPMNPRPGMNLDQWPKFQGVPIVNNEHEYSELLGGEWT